MNLLARDIAQQEVQRQETHIKDSRVVRGHQSTIVLYLTLKSNAPEQEGQLPGWIDHTTEEDCLLQLPLLPNAS